MSGVTDIGEEPAEAAPAPAVADPAGPISDGSMASADDKQPAATVEQSLPAALAAHDKAESEAADSDDDDDEDRTLRGIPPVTAAPVPTVSMGGEATDGGEQTLLDVPPETLAQVARDAEAKAKGEPADEDAESEKPDSEQPESDASDEPEPEASKDPAADGEPEASKDAADEGSVGEGSVDEGSVADDSTPDTGPSTDDIDEVPTQRPGPASPFAGLLAEMDAAEQAPGDQTAKKLALTVGKKSNGEDDTLEPGHERKRRKPPSTFNMEGRGRRTHSRPPSPAIMSEPMPTDRPLGSYRVLGELGSGGMAVVYKAVQPTLDRLVAIKELRTEFVHDKQIAARFEREATSLATLQHGNIVHIYDFVRDIDTSYIVMEYVEGIDLFEVIARTEVLPSDVAAVIAMQIAEGLEYAHYRGIIHRDVKPSNVLISKIGEVKIMDFGIARDPGRADITQIGMALGTPAYMAPEQIRADRVDFRADIFSFGILLYEMLTGHMPWPDDGGQAVARRILAEDPTPAREYNPDIPGPLEAIINRCLQKEPEQRYATTYDLRRDLEAYVAQELTIDPRQRLVVFLRNRRMITEGEASSFVDGAIRHDAELVRRDLGWPTPPPEPLLKKVVIACAIALAGVFAAAIIGAIVPWGERLAPAPPQMVPAQTAPAPTP